MCPRVNNWTGGIATRCANAPWVKMMNKDDVAVSAGSYYSASAKVYYEPVTHPGDPTDQKERIVLAFNSGVTHSGDWHTHTSSNG